MTPAEHRQAGELFDKLRDLPRQSQLEELKAACQGDSRLYSCVSELLDADRKADGAQFLGGNALEDAAHTLIRGTSGLPPIGTQIGHYRLAKKIGAGGMGVVFEAEDLRLPRRVAIKLLPPQAFASENNQEPIQRFEREARAASLLNHPHIVSILDAAFDGGFYYIAMEYVEGRTLRQLLEQEPGGIESSTILDLLSQAASALGAAHSEGVIHRDIKPENIMVRHDGFVKVLDFGLASVRESGSDPKDLRTRPGHLAGTIQYLSPEQVMGKPATARSDLFCLGVVAYELATGRRPFNGDSDGAIFDAILNHSPVPPSAVRCNIGGEVEKMILQLLEKDPDLRFQTAADLRSCCRRLTRDSSRPSMPGGNLRSPQRRLSGKIMWGAAGVLSGGAIAWFMGAASHPLASPLPAHFEQLTSGQGEDLSPSFSPDGKQFVYASHRSGNWDIFLQRTGGRSAVNLTKDFGSDDTQPAFSPDGLHIAFRSERGGGGLFVMEATGENPRRVSTQGYMPSWSPDNRHLVFSTHNFVAPGQVPLPPAQLYVASLDDGSTRLLKTGDALQPSWSPHASRIAYWGLPGGGRREIFTTLPNGTAEPVAITSDSFLNWNPVWAPSGRELYFLSDRGGSKNIWRVNIDEKTGRASGDPEPVTVPADSVASLAISQDGSALIYSRSSRRSNLNRIAFDSSASKIVGPAQPVGEDQIVFGFTFSPDGSQVVYDTIGDTSENLWIMNSDGSKQRALTSDSYRNRGPAWSPRGDEIVFYSDRSGHYNEWVIRSDGSGLRPLTDGPNLDMQNALWSPDGKRILAGRYPPSLMLDASAIKPISTESQALSTLPFSGLVCGSWTDGPDGNLAACDLARKSGGFEAVVYSPLKNELERTGIIGRSTFWAAAASAADVHRRLIFGQGPHCLLYDRVLKRTSELFSASPNDIIYLAADPDGKSIYFTQTIRQANLWVASLAGKHQATKVSN